MSSVCHVQHEALLHRISMQVKYMCAFVSTCIVTTDVNFDEFYNLFIQ